jgi:hypothetical protein
MAEACHIGNTGGVVASTSSAKTPHLLPLMARSGDGRSGMVAPRSDGDGAAHQAGEQEVAGGAEFVVSLSELRDLLVHRLNGIKEQPDEASVRHY